MTEKAPMGDMRLKVKDIVLPADTVKELGDLIPKPENHFHYREMGEYKPNTETFRVQEGDGVVSDYSFPEKSDMSKVQFATRNTYTKELNMWGNLKDKPVKFDRKTGTWKKLSFFESVKHAFHKETDIPAQVVTESINGKDVPVLHTLEQKRPVGKSVQEAQLGTIQDAKVDLGLKYKHMDHTLHTLRDTNRDLEIKNASLHASLRSLNAQMIAANLGTMQQNMDQNNYWESRTGRSSAEPPTYGNITPTQETRKTTKPSEQMKPLTKQEKRTSDELVAQFEKDKKANDAKIDEEYPKWIANHPDNAYYENSGEPYPTKAEYVEMKAKEAAAKKAGRDSEERGLAKD